MKKSIVCAILASSSLTALPQKPWYGNVYEFFFDGSYTYDSYNRFANARGGDKHHSRDHQILLGLGFTPTSEWEAYTEIEFARTTRQEFNWRSAALQGRYLWLDDVSGDDPLSLVTGLSMRGVHHLSLKDISCPYAGVFNTELSLSVGKELSCGPFWTLHTYGFGAIGIAERGAPWTRLWLSTEWNRENKYRFQVFARGDFGFGNRNSVNVNHFNSYANIHHQSIDLGAAYRYKFWLWGTLSFEYARRVYAHAYPEGVNFFTVWYHLPFSFF